MPTILVDLVFCLNVYFNSVNCPAVICSPNTCYSRVTTSADSWEPRSICHHQILIRSYMPLEVVSTIFWCHCLRVTNTAAVLLLLLLSYCYRITLPRQLSAQQLFAGAASYYRCFHITPVSSAFPGAAELTTPLLRLISILCLPLCRINKFGFYFPLRLLRSPILVGYQDYFLAPLPGSIALLISSPGEYTPPLSLFLFYFVLFSLLLFSLFLSCFIFLIYPKIHKNLKNQKSKKLLLWKNMLEPLWNYL